MARRESRTVVALSFEYGQRHAHELACAARLAEDAGAEHVVLGLSPRLFRGSALVDPGPLPAPTPGTIPATYVPARNTLLLAHALALAEARGARDVWIGVNAVDYGGYPDCRPEFVEAFARLIAVGTRAGVEGAPVRLRTPLLRMSKGEIVRRGVALGVDFARTSTCYDPRAGDGAACGACDACHQRATGFAAAGVVDPRPRVGSAP
jgi:7-cyano-7-deazaguanine synthase